LQNNIFASLKEGAKHPKMISGIGKGLGKAEFEHASIPISNQPFQQKSAITQLF